MNRSRFSLNNFCLFLLCCLFAGAVLQLQGEEEKKAGGLSIRVLPVISGFLEAINKEQIGKAYEEFTSKEFKQQTSKDAFEAMIKRNKLEKSSSFQFGSFYSKGDQITFSGAFISTEGQDIPVEIDLRQEKGSWKIIGLQIFQIERGVPRPQK
jgi:hypothetical protein